MAAGMKIHPWPVYLPHAECFLQLLMKLLEDLGPPLDMPCPLTLPFAFLIVFWIADFWSLIYLSPSSAALKDAHNGWDLLFLLTLGLKTKQHILTMHIDFWPWAVCQSLWFSASSSSCNFKSLEHLSFSLQGLLLFCVPRTVYHADKGKHQFTRKGIIHLNITSLTHIDFHFRR